MTPAYGAMKGNLARRIELAGDDRVRAAAGAIPPLASLTDEALMALVGNKDRRAYAVLVQRHLQRMVNVAFRMTGRQAEAEDVVQEAFLRLWRSASNWEERNARFSTWFHRVVINLCIDLSRKRKLAPLESAGELVDENMSAEESAHMKEQSAKISAALQTLPEQQRIAMTLCYYNELSNKEAAQVMELSVKAIESLLVRARRKLATELMPLKAELL